MPTLQSRPSSDHKIEIAGRGRNGSLEVLMTIMIICRARKDISELRRKVRRAHLEYMIRNRDRLVFGGAMLTQDQGSMSGMLVVLEKATLESARQFMAEEPYNKAGMFQEIMIEPFATRVPEPEPGYLQRELERETLVSNN